MTLSHEGIHVTVKEEGRTLCRVQLHEAPGILYAAGLECFGYPAALLKIIRYVSRYAINQDVLLSMDVREPDSWRLFKLYSRIGEVQYVTVKIKPPHAGDSP